MQELSETHDLPVIGSSFGAQIWDAGQSEQILE
jgi:hypothetical protein